MAKHMTEQFIELGAVRMGAAIQNVCANVDFEVLSLPGGSLIAVLLWLYATAIGSIRGATTQVHASRTTTDARSVAEWIVPARQAPQQTGAISR
jgi:hypothetical protein